VRTFDEEPLLGSELLARELLAPFPDLPASVSVAVGDIDPSIGGKPAIKGRQVATEMLRLPQISVATSGQSLVRLWTELEGDTAVAPSPRKNRPAIADERKNVFLVLGRSLREAFAEPDAPAEPQLSDGLRKYGQSAFRLEDEISGALAAVLELAGDKAQPPLFLWTGDGRPGRAALAAARASGALSLGGGTKDITRADASLSELKPLSVKIGGLIQVYNALPGDASNVGFPSGNPHALHELGLLLQRTDKPVRLKPFHLSYSAGTAVQFGTRSAIGRMKRLASESAEIIPLTAAQYVSAVEGFETVRFKKTGPGRWSLSERGSLQTIRIDDNSSYSVDLSASEGVIGARRINSSLYISLDPETSNVLIAVKNSGTPSGLVPSKGIVAIRDTNLSILSARRSRCGLALVASGWGEASLTLQGDPAETYSIAVSTDGKDAAKAELFRAEVVADSDGLATVRFPSLQGKPETVRIHQSCRG
jgi:hypothetical protein